MKSVLFDQNLNRKLAHHIRAHGFGVTLLKTVGLMGVQNGQLLNAAEGRFDVLMTMDRNLPFQNNLSHRNLALLIVRVRIDELEEHLKYIPQAAEILRCIQPGTVEYVGDTDLVTEEKARYARISTQTATRAKRIIP